MPTQNVKLAAELDLFVKEQIEGGNFNNASEVHRAALASMRMAEEERQARLARLRGEVQKRIDSMRSGDFLSLETDDDEGAFLSNRKLLRLPVPTLSLLELPGNELSSLGRGAARHRACAGLVADEFL